MRGRLYAGFVLPTTVGGGILTLVLSCGDGAIEPPPPLPPVPVATSVTVVPASAILTAPEGTARFTAEVRDQDGRIMAGAVVAWWSSDSLVARVDNTGLVTGMAGGATTITAAVGEASGTAEITTVENRDLAALVALYEAAGGPNWANNENWLSDRPLGEWYGVEVDRSGRVEELQLPNNNLSGEIPPEVGDLTNLVRLELRSNELSASIPPALGNLARLERLYVRNNRLTGPIPSELGDLTSLVRLELHSNRLSGTMPRSMLQLANLTDVEFDRNDGLCAPGTREFVAWIQGMERADGPFCDVAALRQLFEAAGGSGWTRSEGWLGAPVLADWHGIRTDSSGRVTEVDLTGNGLSGRLSGDIGALAHLTALKIADNMDLAGRLPVSLSRLSLQTLHYSGTALCAPAYISFRDWLGAIPSHAGTGAECPPLSDREILVTVYETTGGPNWRNRDNWLTDVPLRDWYGVGVDASGRVERLRLGENGLSGSIPAEISELADLERLYLDENNLSGPIPPEIGELADLERLRAERERVDRLDPSPTRRSRKPDPVADGGQPADGPIASRAWQPRGASRDVPRCKQVGGYDPS